MGSLLGNKDKEIYIESLNNLVLPVISSARTQDTSEGIDRISGRMEFSLTEQFSENPHTVPTTNLPQHMNKLNSSTSAYRKEHSKENLDLKRERSRRLAREFRARRKEEILQYRGTIVSLTHRIGVLMTENRKLQHMVEELRSSLKRSTSSLLDADNDISNNGALVLQLQQQILQLQLLLSNVSQCQSQKDHHERAPSNSTGLYKTSEQVSFTLPPLKTTLKDSLSQSPYSIIPEMPNSPIQVQNPRLNEVALSYCTMETRAVDGVAMLRRDGDNISSSL